MLYSAAGYRRLRRGALCRPHTTCCGRRSIGYYHQCVLITRVVGLVYKRSLSLHSSGTRISNVSSIYNNMAPIVLDRLPHTIHSLPYGVVSTLRNARPRCAVAIGDHAIDLVEYFRGKPPSQFSFDDSVEQIFGQVCELPMCGMIEHDN